ncbi:MAG TPA: hypothetical protein VD884_10360 [Ohtaekwangia sp.]|nr:hypothetical protein [Ohtaekwangia sp.]
MKYAWILLLFIITATTVIAQPFNSVKQSSVPESDLDHYKTDYAPGLRMRNVGRTLTIAGSALLVGGIIVFASADERYYTSQQTQYGTHEEGDPKALLGLLMITGGAGMTVPGIILWSKGAKKFNNYIAREREALSLNLSVTRIGLKYHF